MKTIRGKRALVTGATSDVGRAIALALARHGADIMLVDRHGQGLSKVAEELKRFPIEVIVTRCDPVSPPAIDAVAHKLIAVWNELDILINQSGVVRNGPSECMSDQQFQWMLDVNLHAPIRLTRKVLPLLIDNAPSHIVNIGSVSGLVARRNLMAYQVSKFGLQGFSESLMAEYGRYGVGVTSICPGYVKSRLVGRAGIGDGGRLSSLVATSPDVIARKTVRAIRLNQPLVTVSPCAHALWFLKRLAPALFLTILGRRRRTPLPTPAFTPTFLEHGDGGRRAA